VVFGRGDTLPRRLILWDVDGTLMSAGPVGRSVFDAAVRSVVGRTAIDHGVHMSGKTDPQIALEILARLAVSDDEARDHLPGVLRALERNLESAIEAINRDGRVHPGVEDVLRRLDADGRVIQTVLSGNLRANARIKLAAFGLDRWLDLEVGAYGSDHEDRTRLVPVALERVERMRGHRFEASGVWVVGDTLADLACARAAGVRCLLVATGRIPLEELAAGRPDAVLPDLSDVRRVVSILAGDVGPSKHRPSRGGRAGATGRSRGPAGA
jgi:phosphoglycolate phosphatase